MIKKLLTKSKVIWISVFLSAIILNSAFFIFPAFADALNDSLSGLFRLILAKITNLLPFSLAEILIYLSLPLAVLIAILAVRKKTDLKSKLMFVLGIIGKTICVVYFAFVITFAPGYSSESLDIKLGFEKSQASAIELYDTLIYVIERTNEYAEKVSYTEHGASEATYTLEELSATLCDAYSDVYTYYGLSETFNSKIKPLIISPLMTYTHISGVYTFFTGEANLNTNYPDFVNTFSAAHELAHQRGIAREDEANFMAYLVCISSSDDYIRYCGYLNMYEYLASALYKADKALYKDAVSHISEKVRNELTAYSIFFDKYRNDTVATVSDTMNDVYLKSQGTKGSVSYGMVVDLAVAYHKNCK